MEKEYIASVCENLYKECLREIPQFENGKLVWILNGSTLCNFLCNVVKIDDVEVSEEFTKCCYEFIRQPKGDVDITYKADRPYKFDLENKSVKEFQKISREQRTYNFVDSNCELSDNDFEELCTMETKSGLKFVAKKPQYLFLYKFKEFLALFGREILENDFESINSKKENIIADVTNLYGIALSYCGQTGVDVAFMKLSNISTDLNKLYNKDKDGYHRLISAAFAMIDLMLKKKTR